jgi:hypothetical protein
MQDPRWYSAQFYLRVGDMRSQSINQHSESTSRISAAASSQHEGDLTKHSDDLIRPFGRIIRTEWSFKAAASPPTDGVINLAARSIREYPDHASEAEAG